MRRCAGLLVMLSAAGFLSGCADQKPKPGGVTTVSPAVPGKAAPADAGAAKPTDGAAKPTDGGAKPADPEAKPEEGETKPADGGTKPTPPGDAGSTTGGGTETPSTPGDGQ